ncbi:MAG: DUF4230 domain-containing protein [Bacteroidales bacterium]|nr:DUF4230 domain-containing protein [Bacteroidales bacterium]
MKKVLKLLIPMLLVIMSITDCSHPTDIRTALSNEVVVYTTSIKASETFREETDYEFVKFFERLLKREIILPVVIQLKAAIYCSQIDKNTLFIDEQNKVVELTLPEPKFDIEGFRIDWDNVAEYSGTFRSDFGSEEKEKIARKAIEKWWNEDFEQNKQIYTITAKQDAEKSLTSIIEHFGYKAIIHY